MGWAHLDDLPPVFTLLDVHIKRGGSESGNIIVLVQGLDSDLFCGGAFLGGVCFFYNSLK